MFSRKKQETALELHARLVAEDKEADRRTQDGLQYVMVDGEPVSIENTSAIQANLKKRL